MKDNEDFIANIRIVSEIFGIGKANEESYIKRVFAEVYQILQHSEDAVFKRIPNSFVMFLQENLDKTWQDHLDFSKSIREMDLLRETRIILSLVYRDFVCTAAKRKELVEKDRIEFQVAGVEATLNLNSWF